MNKKGFTGLEVLGVFFISGLIWAAILKVSADHQNVRYCFGKANLEAYNEIHLALRK